MFFAWAHVFFFPFHKPNYYECAFFLAKPTTHARVVRHTILKRNGKKKPWAQTNNSLPNNHVRHNEASFNSTKWRCPYDNVTYCKFTPNRKQLPKQLPPPLHMARTWMDMHRLRRLHDSQYIMKNPFTNENSNLSNIFHNNIHRKKVESLKVRSTEEFLCQFAWLPCRFFRGRRQGRQPLNIESKTCWHSTSRFCSSRFEVDTVVSSVFVPQAKALKKWWWLIKHDDGYIMDLEGLSKLCVQNTKCPTENLKLRAQSLVLKSFRSLCI